MIQNIQEWKTTLIGGIGLILTILVFLGKITSQEATELTQYSDDLVKAILSISLIFYSQDPK